MMAALTHYKTLIDGAYLGQWDLFDAATGAHKRPVVEIEKVERYTPEVRKTKRLPDGTKAPEPLKRLQITFKRCRKKWLAGPVSQKVLAGMFGPHVEAWLGRRVTLYVDESVMFGREKTGGIRVENREAKGPATTDALEGPVDEEKAAAMDRAAGREPGSDDE
jgi:hypothetical protein